MFGKQFQSSARWLGKTAVHGVHDLRNASQWLGKALGDTRRTYHNAKQSIIHSLGKPAQAVFDTVEVSPVGLLVDSGRAAVERQNGLVSKHLGGVEKALENKSFQRFINSCRI